MATTPPDPSLAAELEAFAQRKAGVGAWAGAAWALVEASRLSSDREQRERLLLKAVDAMIGAGDLIQADAFAQEVEGFAPAAMGDATMGYLAVLRGRPGMPRSCCAPPGSTATTPAIRLWEPQWRNGSHCTG